MPEEKEVIDLVALKEYDKGVKDALSKKASTEHDHDVITAEEIRNIFKASNYEDGDTGKY